MQLELDRESLEGLRRTDDLDRSLLHRLTGFAYLGPMLQAGVPYRIVPEGFWALDRDDRGSVAVVACPCGQEPRAELAAYPVKCECERSFFFDGTEVWALNTPAA